MDIAVKSVITHDKQSDRVYLMKLHQDDLPGIVEYIDDLAGQYGYTKIFAKIPSRFAPSFIRAGYCIEAVIPRFFHDGNDVFLMCRYFSEDRRNTEHDAIRLFQDLLEKPHSQGASGPPESYVLKALGEDDIDSMVNVFRKVFESYPFPVFEPSFLLHGMKCEGTRYFGAFYKEKLVAVGSAECDAMEGNAEMTDFAVLPAHRGKHLSSALLSLMESELGKEGFSTLYTICRLKSIAMNKTFLAARYRYSGTLIRNTQISGDIESMNVWYKNLCPAEN